MSKINVPKPQWHFFNFTVTGTNPDTGRTKKEKVFLLNNDKEKAIEKSGLINVTDVEPFINKPGQSKLDYACRLGIPYDPAYDDSDISALISIANGEYKYKSIPYELAKKAEKINYYISPFCELKNIQNFLKNVELDEAELEEVNEATLETDTEGELEIQVNNITENWNNALEKPGQNERLKRAQSVACTPIEFNRDDSCGVFSGKNGIYKTTLNNCTCVDFNRRKLPCKHIYRLAIELGLIDETAESDIRKVKRPTPPGYSYDEAIDIIERLPTASLLTLKEAMYLIFYNRKQDLVGICLESSLAPIVEAGVLEVSDDLFTKLEAFGRNEIRDRLIEYGITDFKKNASHKELSKWVCENVSDADSVFSDAVAVRISDKFIKSSRQIYMYLCNLFSDDVETAPDTKIEGDFKICENCGAKATHNEVYCPKCHTMLFTTKESPQIKEKAVEEENNNDRRNTAIGVWVTICAVVFLGFLLSGADLGTAFIGLIFLLFLGCIGFFIYKIFQSVKNQLKNEDENTYKL